MHETHYKQAFMGALPSNKSINDTVQVDEPEQEVIEDTEDLAEGKEETTEEPTKESEEPTAESNDSAVDVSDGDSESEDVSDGDSASNDISTGDVSDGDTSSGDADKPIKQTGATTTAPVYTTCAYEPKPNLWESDINEYDTTDGLLLLILVFTVINTAFNVLRKRG